MQKTCVPDVIPISSRIQVTAFELPDELDDLNLLVERAAGLPGMPGRIRLARFARLKRMRDQLKARMIKIQDQAQRQRLLDAYPAAVAEAVHDSGRLTCLDALRAGEVPEAKVVGHDGGDNLILRGLWEDLFARFKGTPTSDQTLKIKYLALGTSYAPTDFEQADLTNETFRGVPQDQLDDGVSTFYATLWTKKSEANPAHTTVTSATADTITVASTTGIIVNGRLQVETDNADYKMTVVSVVGSVVTVKDIIGGALTSAAQEFPAGDIPVNPNPVYVLIAEGGCIISDDASATLNTGKAMNRRLLETKKHDKLGLLWDYITNGKSVDV